MRLIDADALKKAYFNAIEKSSIGEVSILNLIDNAPTVDITKTLSKFRNTAFQNGYTTGLNNAPTIEPCYQTTSCLDCKNYDKANYYCPRFCEVIREVIKNERQDM